MTRTTGILVCCGAVVAGLAWACASYAAPIIWDSFEPFVTYQGWTKCSGSSWTMETDERHLHSGQHSALAQPNWRYSYTLCRPLPAAYAENVFLSVWVWDDCVIPPGLPGPPDNPYNWSNEHVPHARIRMENSNGFDFLHLACIGVNKTASDPQWPDNIYFSVESAYEGKKLLNGPPRSVVIARREPGWRRWMIRLKPFTGTKGDVEYYLDGQLVYQGYRSTADTGGATIDRIGLGSGIWTGEWYWYDDVEFDYWPSPTTVTSIQQALGYPDGAWLQINGLTVQTVRPEDITVSDAASDQIDLAPARFEAPGDVVNVLGRLVTSEAGRYMDTHVLTRVSTAAQIQVSSIAEARELPDGTRVKLPARVCTALLGPVRFIEEQDRTSGLKIRNIYEPEIGDMLIAEGQMMTVGPEKLLEAEKVSISTYNNPLPDPVGVANRSLYPPSVIPSGMLVVTTGLVVNRPDMWFPGWFEMRDGSQPESDFPVRVQVSSSTICPQIGDYVWVRGAAGWLVESIGSRPMIYCRYSSDLRKLKEAVP